VTIILPPGTAACQQYPTPPADQQEDLQTLRSTNHQRTRPVSEGIRYVMAVSCDQAVATGDGPARAEALAARPGLAWRRMSCGDGAKGPRLYDFAQVPDAGSGAHRLVIRRAIDDGELASFWCHTPAGASLADLVRVIGLRWAVEECLQAANGQVGLDHYQVRSYPGWYHEPTVRREPDPAARERTAAATGSAVDPSETVSV
jgi:SRSO17 transposase